MVEQRDKNARRDHLTNRAGRRQASPTGCAIGLRTAATVNESVLAVAAIADVSGLNEFLGLAAHPGNGSARANANGRPDLQARRVNPVEVLRCRVVWRLVTELFAMAGDRDLPEGTAQRRPRCHMRQIAMYLSHVVLSVPYRTIAIAFGRDRTTVVHACSVVEDRRDDTGYDRFVERCERCVEAVFAPFGCDHAEL